MGFRSNVPGSAAQYTRKIQILNLGSEGPLLCHPIFHTHTTHTSRRIASITAMTKVNKPFLDPHPGEGDPKRERQRAIFHKGEYKGELLYKGMIFYKR